MLASSLLAAAGSALVFLANPTAAFPTGQPNTIRPRSCALSATSFSLPASAASTLTTDGLAPKFALIGLGNQLYNCSNSSWITNGAAATLFDASCLVSKGSSFLNSIATQAATFAEMNPDAAGAAMSKAAGVPLPKMGTHYFVQTPGSTTAAAISPKFDFSTAVGGSLTGDGSFFLGAKAASVSSPSGSQNVPWLKLTDVQGSLAKEVFRVYTVSGQATGTCTAGQTKVVAYAAQYWMFA